MFRFLYLAGSAHPFILFRGPMTHNTQASSNAADDEKSRLDDFAEGRIECLLTCKKISEGIDISSVTNIFLFASDRSKLVTTQRIGRALRLDKRNPSKKATVIDFILEDAAENDNNADQERKDWLTGLSETRRNEDEE